ncbi:phage major capsid protein, P2 family [Avibacterium sp. 20-129]|uniref:phage major capsid protein, P2 family n=1 Tax=Avibacterium sp. 20-129 TaxID=2911525 RepID=UPI002247C80B|nr:phage major capsid protein, P2 family [Avibacterium sp. 20-129]MCW9699820.1 phage major capsid protein, P2 family [Avibacterium sp. 20-129]
MKKFTQQKFDAYVAGVAADNNVDITLVSKGGQYTVEPTIQQKLENAVLENSDFLKRINIVLVDEMKGSALRLGVLSPVASRTDTNTKARETTDIHSLQENDYSCEKTNFDTHLNYATLDSWAKFPDFAARVGKLKAERIALDRIMIGWNGTSIAKTTDRDANPLLQDVNKGWLVQIEEKAPARVMTEVEKSSGKIEVGTGKVYKNLDALVFSLKEDFIPPQYRDDTKLVAIMGSDLLADKYFPLINQEKPSEQVAGDTVISQKRVGGLQAVSVPYFPKGTVLITSLDNLSIYVQEGKVRRSIKDKPERDRVEDYLSSNEAYVVENYEAVAMAKNITIVDAPAKTE